MTDRPLGISILTILTLGNSLALLLFGALLQAMPILQIIVGLFGLVVSVGFWTAKKWAWVLGIVAELLTIVSSVLLLKTDLDAFISLIIAVMVLGYLVTPDAREFFGL